MALLGQKSQLAELWAGVKHGGDTSRSGLDYSLAQELGWQGVSNVDVAGILTRYPHGQIGSGKLRGQAADRRLAALVGAAQRGQGGPR